MRALFRPAPASIRPGPAGSLSLDALRAEYP